MKTVYFNGKIYVERETFADSMLIVDEYVQAVGSFEEVTENLSDYQTVDLEGKTVIPGFNDSHCHILFLGNSLRSVKLSGTKSVDEIIAKSKEFLQKNPDTKMLNGTGWNQDYFTENNNLPTRYDLDKISCEIPIIFSRACGHLCVSNSKALELANITKDTQAVFGGVIYTDQNGEPNGLFSENATSQIKVVVPKQTPENIADVLTTAMEYCASYGITSVQTCDLKQNAWQTIDQGYKLVYKTFDNAIRSYQQSTFSDTKEYGEFIAAGNITGAGDNMYKYGPLKMFVDGSLGARTALMREPYADDPTTKGVSTMTVEHLDDMVKLADDNKCQVAVHCIGDGAIEMMLNAYDKVVDGGNKLRHGVVHCQITDSPLIARFLKKDILAYIQPIFIDYDMTVLVDRVGEVLALTSYLFGDMYKLGIKTSYGTDAPVEDINPYNNIYCAVTRKRLDGSKQYRPCQTVDMYDAIDQYTISSAYASFEENYKGRLKAGYLADFAILDKDIFTVSEDEIQGIRPVKTFVGGKEIYSK